MGNSGATTRNIRPMVASLLVLAAVAIGLLAWAISRAPDEGPQTPAGTPPPAATDQIPAKGSGPTAPDAKEGPQGQSDYAVPPPPFSEGVFPCTACHNGDMPANPKRRVLKMAHRDIQLHHDEEHRWCLDCHNADDRDVLRSASGAPIPFAESYRLCVQCHGDKYRDWKEGIHGKRTGQWNGRKSYLLCVNCHSPHSPKFKPIQPLPPPVRPENLRATPSPPDEKKVLP
jgi:hypothetical protein